MTTARHTATRSALVALAAGALLTSGLAGTGLASPASAIKPAAAQAAATSTLNRGQTLASGQSLVSPNGRWSVSVLADGQLVYRDAPNRLSPQGSLRVLAGETGSNVAGSRLVFQDDGNIVLSAPDGKVVADFATQKTGAQRLSIQDDGNLVVYAADGRSIETDQFLPFFGNAGFDLRPGDVLLPGDRRASVDGGTRLVMQTDGNLVVYTGGQARFSSGTQGRTGAAAVMQRDGNFVVYGAKNEVLFSTGTSRAQAGDDGDLLVGAGEFLIFVSDEGGTIAYGSAWGTSTVLPGDGLLPGERRTSPRGRYRLNLTVDGDLSVVGRGTAFSSRTRGEAVVGIMQEDGNFVLYDLAVQGAKGPKVVFQTRTSGNPGARLVVQDDGNLVVYSTTGKALFSTR